MIKCKHCKTDKHVRIQVYAHVSAPVEMYSSFSKKNMRKKDFNVLAVLWETTDFMCTKCNTLLKKGRPMRYYSDDELDRMGY